MLAFVGAAPMVRIDWTPKAEGATGLEALASVQAEQQVWINEGVTRTRTTLDLRDQPGGTGPVDDRSAGRPEGGQRLRRQRAPMVGRGGRRPAADHGPTVRAGQGLAAGDRRTGEVRRRQGAGHDCRCPWSRRVGVGRQQGVVVVQVAEGLRAEAAKTSGLLQVDAAELPPRLSSRRSGRSPIATPPCRSSCRSASRRCSRESLADSLVEAYSSRSDSRST